MRNFAGLRAACNGGGKRSANRTRVRYGTKHDLGAGFIGDNIRRVAAANRADIERAGAEQRIVWQRNTAYVLQDIEERMNRGVAQLRVGGMRELSPCDDLEP